MLLVIDGPRVVWHDVVGHREALHRVAVGIEDRVAVLQHGVVVDGDVVAAVDQQEPAVAAPVGPAHVVEQVVLEHEVVRDAAREAVSPA
jgi:hypothetical protein